MAIKANELRTSNILKLFLGVNDEGAQYREFTISGVMSNDGAEFYLLGHTWVEISDNLEPIPLTEEWLLRFGFEKVVDGEFKKGNLTFQITKYEGGDLVTVFLNGNLLNFVHFVHQLQNLFYALTGEELQYTPSKI